VARTLLVAQLLEEVDHDGAAVPLATLHASGGGSDPSGHRHLESFRQEGKTLCWTYALGEARLEQRIVMPPGVQATYLHYRMRGGEDPLPLRLGVRVGPLGTDAFHLRADRGRCAPRRGGGPGRAFRPRAEPPAALAPTGRSVIAGYPWFDDWGRDTMMSLADPGPGTQHPADLRPPAAHQPWLRSLDPGDPRYGGRYGGDRAERDRAYHQGTVWSWWLGPFVLAHARVHGDARRALPVLAPMAHHLGAAVLGSISGIFEGDPPHAPRGCFAQVWSVAELLRSWPELSSRA
jgi:hypothetical protein